MTQQAAKRGGETGNDASAAAGVEPGPAVRALEVLAPDVVVDRAALTDLVALPSFAAVKDYFSAYPRRGLSSSVGRSLMFHIVKAMRPELVIEIGTYYAGMTEVIARALWENGAGHIVTIDPYGADRVPPVIATWPDALAKHVIYAPMTSMDLYIDFDRTMRRYDLAFIDGYHPYEFAFYDLISLAKWIRPGGVIVVDDFKQPGVFWAVKHFLRLNPTWRELGGAMNAWRPTDPFGSIRESVPGSNFLLLAPPPVLEIVDTPIPFEGSPFTEPGVSGFELDLAADNARGFLHGMVMLRSSSTAQNGVLPEQQMVVTKTILEATPGRRVVKLPAPLITKQDPATSLRSVEIVLSWQCLDGRHPLRLQAEPKPLFLR